MNLLSPHYSVRNPSVDAALDRYLRTLDQIWEFERSRKEEEVTIYSCHCHAQPISQYVAGFSDPIIRIISIERSCILD